MTIGLSATFVDFDSLSLDINVVIPPDFLSTSQFESALPAAIKNMANDARDFWLTLAGQNLKSSRIAYQQAIRVDVVEDSSFSLLLDGPLAFSVEKGSEPYPMHIGYKVAPLNVDREVYFTNPKVFVRGKGKPWMHPGLPGVNFAKHVVEELHTVIIPRHIQKIVEDL